MRIKALQALYANEKGREALYNMGLQYFDEVFNPVLFDEPDKDQLKDQKNESKRLFSKHFEDDKPKFEASTDFVSEKVTEAIDTYQGGVTKEAAGNRKEMLKELNDINGTFLSIIGLLIDLSRISEDFKKKNLGKNKAVNLLRGDGGMERRLEDSSIRWSQHYDTVRGWFRDIVGKTDQYLAYEEIESPSFEDDKTILNQIVKKILFKNESIQDFLEEKDMRWGENKAIVKSLVTKSIKDLEDGQKVELRPISYNWEEDVEFFEKLYIETLKREDVLEPVIAENSRNWEYERIAAVDKIILRMALTEMIIFPSIPIKVTINEYLEIAKQYSTPKSKQFINGVLDITAKKLIDEGVIKKSGRGLIDNK